MKPRRLELGNKTMKEINLDVLKDAAHRLMFDMSKEEYQTLLKEFDILTKQMNKMGEIEGLENYEPMTFPFDVTIDFIREDIPQKPLDKEDALRNAGSVLDGEIKLPKVVG